MEKHYTTTNGINVYAYPLQHLHSFCMSLYIKAGILYEGKNENGITHFLEHIHFRNLGGIAQDDLYKRLDLLGANFNACTYKEFMCFYISAPTQHFNECAQIFIKLLSELKVTDSDVRAERKRIQSEIREDDQINSLQYYSNKKIWYGTGLDRLITGTIKDVNAIDLDMLKTKKSEIFTQNNIFFYVTGCYSTENIKNLCHEIEKCSIPHSQHICNNYALLPSDFKNRNAQVIIKKYDYSPDIQFTFDVEYEKYSLVEMNLLYHLLFTGEFSRFKMFLSERKGLLYGFDAYLKRYSNIGTIYLQFSVMKSNLIDSIRMATHIFHSIKIQITQDDIDRITRSYIESRYLLLDDAKGVNWEMAYDNHILSGCYKSVEELGEISKAVTPKRLLDIANEIFQPQNLIVSIKCDKRKSTIDRVKEIIGEL